MVRERERESEGEMVRERERERGRGGAVIYCMETITFWQRLSLARANAATLARQPDGVCVSVCVLSVCVCVVCVCVCVCCVCVLCVWAVFTAAWRERSKPHARQ